MNPLVTILMPVYNSDAYITDALASIVNQTYRNLEIIIVDDGCTDSSMDIVNSFHDPRVVVIKNRENEGLAACLNKAIQRSAGAFLARMDADDIAYPNRIDKQVNFLLENPTVDVLGTAMQYIGESAFLNIFPETHEACKSHLLLNVCFGHPTVMFRETVFMNPENLYNPIYRQYSEEFDLWCRLVDHHRFHNLTEVLLYYRTYPVNLKSDVEQRRKNNSAEIRKRFLLKELGDVTDENLAIHDLVWFNELCSNLNDLRRVDTWLMRIIELNKKSRAFDEQVLMKQLAERFFEVCYQNTKLGIRSMKYFYASTWSKLYKTSPKISMKFFVKQLINYR